MKVIHMILILYVEIAEGNPNVLIPDNEIDEEDLMEMFDFEIQDCVAYLRDEVFVCHNVHLDNNSDAEEDNDKVV